MQSPMKSIFYILCLAVVLSSCSSTPKLAVPDKFKEVSERMHLKGVNNWVFNQKLSFGKYNTTKVKRGWSFATEDQQYNLEQRLMKLYGIDHFNTVNKERNKYRFTIEDDRSELQVFCQEKMRTEAKTIRTGTKILGDLSRTDRSEYHFTAAILPSKDSTQSPWELVLTNTYDRSKDTARRLFDIPKTNFEGYVTNGKEVITINPVRVASIISAKGKESKFPVKILSGYELRIDDGVIAIIDKLDNNLWIYNELEEPLRLIVAATCSALLLRQMEGTREI